MTKRQMLAEAAKRVGINIETEPAKLSVLTNSGVSYIETKFYGAGDVVPQNKRQELARALKEIFGASAIGIGYHITVKVPREPHE